MELKQKREESASLNAFTLAFKSPTLEQFPLPTSMPTQKGH